MGKNGKSRGKSLPRKRNMPTSSDKTAEVAMRLCPLLSLRGKSRDAINFYSEIFHATPEVMTYGEMPPDPHFPVSEDIKDLILHAEIFIAKDLSIMLGDDMRPGEGIMGNALSLTLMLDNQTELRRLFKALADGGTVLMPLRETFWSVEFGTVTDRFGVTWHLNLCRMPEKKTAVS